MADFPQASDGALPGSLDGTASKGSPGAQPGFSPVPLQPSAKRAAPDVVGRLIILRGSGESGGFQEEAVSFHSLVELLDLCSARTQGDPLVRVEVGDAAGSQGRLLVLDFGRFGAVAPESKL